MSLVKDVLTRKEIIEAFDAIIDGDYRTWRMKYPPSKRFPDYFILLAVRDLLESNNKEDNKS